jgi:cytochrome c5
MMRTDSHFERYSPAGGRSLHWLLAAAVLGLGWGLAGTAQAQNGGRSGEQVVAAVCSGCHASGKLGAPKIGDKKAWSARAERGLTALTHEALQGIRNMPSHGGNPGLSDKEIERAIVYMVDKSGGNWVEPIDTTRPASERSGEQVVKTQCFKCHEEGKGGAPRIGDRAAWIQRLKNGLEPTVRSAVNGHGGMPARGGLANLSDAEIRSAVLYMLNAGNTAAPPK